MEASRITDDHACHGTCALARRDFLGVAALVRTGPASFVALSMRCPHQGYTVTVNSSGVYCPAHGARFSGTGVWQSGQKTSNLTSVAATYDAVAGTVGIAR